MPARNLYLLLMINKKNFILLLIFFLLNNCSFDSKTGLWKGDEDEKKRIKELRKEQSLIIDVEKIYSSDNINLKEKILKKTITLSSPKKNDTWEMNSLNKQNFIGNIYLPGIDNLFFKKKFGKKKYPISRFESSLLYFNDHLIFADDRGTIYKITNNGKLSWKNNIYKKVYKNIYKNLVLSIYKNKLFIADNVGFVYSVNLDNGELIWIKDYGIPLKSNIKVFDDKIFLIDQNNRILSLNVNDGTKIWDILTISSFIKSQNLLSLAISEKGDLIALNSSADLYRINSKNGYVYWTSNTLTSLLSDATDFFKSSQVVINNDEIIFSAGPTMLSYNLTNGFLNWETEINSISAPIIDGKNIFCVTKEGYFVILNKQDGKVISSTNILNNLKKKKKNTQVTGFTMGSNKIYSATLNGYLIVNSASTGKFEKFKKIGSRITTSPIISKGSLYILTEESEIIALN